MKNLFDAASVQATKHRISQLRPESQRLWGSMTVAQTLAHCTSGLDMAMGVIKPKRAPFPADLVGRMIKPLFFRMNFPMPRNAGSLPELLSTHPADFELERSRLILTIDKFVAQSVERPTEDPHPYFGHLKPQQWAILMYTHIDHHLRQFGV